MESESKYKNITCIIFAGGKSSRMGEDKALLPFKNFDSLAQYQYQKFAPYFDNIYISTKEKDKFNFNANFIEDLKFYNKENNELIYSPAIAIYSVFKKLELKQIFAISVDAPFFNIEHFQKLYKENTFSTDIIMSKNKMGLHPLCSIYKQSCQEELLKMIEQDVHKLRILTKNLNTKYIDFNDDKAFLNLNNKNDYEKAIKL